VSLPPVEPSDRAPGLHVERGVVLPDDIELAPHVTIYAGVELGAGVSIGQGAIVGRPHQRDARSHAPLPPAAAATLIGAGCMVGSGAVVDAGGTLAAGARLADSAILRWGAVVEEEAMVGWGVVVGRSARVGRRTRIQNSAIVGPWVAIGADVLIAPRVVLVSDDTMGRRDHVEAPGIVLDRACRIGTGAIIVPPARIGEEAVVGAASLVKGDVAPRTVVAGTPARVLREVRDDELLEAWMGDSRP
jgi:acetyltransferase-like isoleucine patch superfamily enzyme